MFYWSPLCLARTCVCILGYGLVLGLYPALFAFARGSAPYRPANEPMNFLSWEAQLSVFC